MKQDKFILLEGEQNKKMIFSQDGSYLVFFHNLSGQLNFEIQTSGVNLEILGLYTGKNKDSFKLSTIQRHMHPHSKSNLLVKGIFDDSSTFEYKGLIRIEKKAKNTFAYQKNQNILLSPSVFVSSRPDLEILAADVYCTHGSTTGKLNKDELFFVESRKVVDNNAKKLLISGFIRDIFTRMEKVGFDAEAEKIRSKVLKHYA